MAKIYNNILECIGKTPLVKINSLNENQSVTVLAKLESMNPGGSVKDRPALKMIEEAEKRGELTHEKIIIEATSGNTGIGLAMVAAVKGYKLVLAMPETASLERRKILKAFGAEILLTPGELGTDGAIEKVYELVREHPDRYFMPDQFNNEDNMLAHYETTGKEIYEDTDGQVDVVVVTLGTTGTSMGVARILKELNPNIRVIGVEPYMGHKIQGLKNMKESYRPGLFDKSALDEIIFIDDDDAFETARQLARKEGIFVGMSSGAAMYVALQVAKNMDRGVVVALLPDGGERYLSTNLFATTLEPDFSFYNFLTKKKEKFKTVDEGKVTILTTGPTLDNLMHLGHCRRFVFADVLRRYLEYKGFDVHQVVNVIDLDERTIQGASKENRDLGEFTSYYLDAFFRDLEELKILPAQQYERASEHKDDIIRVVDKLFEKGLVYEKLRSVYFDISKSKTYGELSHVDPKNIRPGKVVEFDSYEKLNPRDFALLKRASLDALKRGFYVKTTWGSVIPTWHASAASIALTSFGSTIDIYASSTDFLFPHLENVLAIGKGLTDKMLANHWLLCEVILQNGKRMSHVTNNAVIFKELIEKGYRGEVIRFWLLSSHYRNPIHFSIESLEKSRKALRRAQEFFNRLHFCVTSEREDPEIKEIIYQFEQKFFDALADDLNTAKAFGALFQFIRQLNPYLDRNMLHQEQKKKISAVSQEINGIIQVFDLDFKPLSEEEQRLLAARDRARKEKNWAEADRLRDKLLKRGIRVLDTPQGTRWERI
ncbi:MAG TPA: cysteine synthase A [Deltaproteobacteria bacterium]|nr:cysteine synthase A [Deltaproteobacteria bacterium]